MSSNATDRLATSPAPRRPVRLTLTTDQQRQQADCAASATSAACGSDQQKVAMDQAELRQHADQAQATLTADQAALTQAQEQLAQLEAVAGSPGSFYTGLAAAGAVVTQGQTLYWIDGRPRSASPRRAS